METNWRPLIRCSPRRTNIKAKRFNYLDSTHSSSMSVQPLESPKPTAASGPAFRTPARWDVPLDQNMTEKDVERLLALPPFSLMDPSRFPASASLRDILLNDSRIRHFSAGDIVVREG